MTIKKLSGFGAALLMSFSMSSVYAEEEAVETQTQLQTQTQEMLQTQTQEQLQAQTQTQEQLQTQTQEMLQTQTQEQLDAHASENAVSEQYQYQTRQQGGSSSAAMTRQRTPRSSTGGNRH